MKTTFTAEEDQYIKDNYLKIPIKALSRNINRSSCGVRGRMKAMNLTVPKALAKARQIKSLYKSGSSPSNKGKKQIEYMSLEAIERTKATRFKKGNVPYGTKYNGYERKDSYGYIHVRISKGVYKLKHVFNWEKTNGKIPEGHCLKSIDGNNSNTNINNWRLISRAENMYINSKHNYPKEIIPSLVLINKLNNTLKNINNGSK